MSNKTEQNALICISTCEKIIRIFLGPFLVFYFIKISENSIIDISVYNIISILVCTITQFIVAYIVKNKFKTGMFRIGVIVNFIYILVLLVLKDGIKDHLYLIAIIYGFITTYYFPLNIYIANKVKNEERINYEVKRKTISCLVSIITPIVLGTLITTTDYTKTAIIILVVSIIQILASFFLKTQPITNNKFGPIKAFKELKKQANFKRTMLNEFFSGTSLAESAVGTIITILIFNSFKTNMNLGIITSVTFALTILGSYFYGKEYKNKDNSKLFIILSIIPLISLSLLILLQNDITVIIYNLFYTIVINLLVLIIDVYRYNTARDTYQNNISEEFWCIREVVLNAGKIISFSLLLIVGLLNNIFYLNIILVILTGLIIIMALIGIKIDKIKINN